VPDNAASLPDDIESLRRLVAAQRSELAAERAARIAAEGALLSRDLLIEKLKVQIARLKRMHFGRSSEKLASEIAQLELALEELETAEAELPPLPASPIRECKTPDRSLPAHLPREEIVHLPASGDCVCPACGGGLRRLAEDADEMLDIEPVVFKVIRHVRPKFSCRACEKIVQAPAPDKAIARGKASFRVIGHIIVSKFDHHLPLYRQAEMMAAQGVDIDRSTLAGWTGQGAALLDPIVARIRETVLSASKLHTDDTPVPMLDPGNGKTKTARLWAELTKGSGGRSLLEWSAEGHAIDDRAHGGLAKPAVWFAFTTDRRAEHPKSMLKDFRGYLQADAYPGYDDLYRTGRIVEVACWGHARRKIFDLHESKPTVVTTELLERIARLYSVEEDVRGQPPDTRRATRQAQSKPQLDELKARMEAIRAKLSAKSTLAVAITYALKRWPALTRYCEDGRLEIDNLIAERALRGVAIGRRNWLFAGSKAGGERAAAIYSIIETCKLNGVEPFAYISGVMQKIAEGWPNSRIDELMPWAWSPIAQQKAA
jgi:transposase